MVWNDKVHVEGNNACVDSYTFTLSSSSLKSLLKKKKKKFISEMIQFFEEEIIGFAFKIVVNNKITLHKWVNYLNPQLIR